MRDISFNKKRIELVLMLPEHALQTKWVYKMEDAYKRNFLEFTEITHECALHAQAL
jgi:hypothetical protein